MSGSLLLALLSVAGVAGEADGQAAPALCRRIRTDPGAAAPRWLEGCGRVAPGGSPEAAGRAALAPLASMLRLRSDGRDLTLLDVDRSPRSTRVRFQQTHKGVPVYLGQALVKFDAGGEVELVNNHTRDGLDVDVDPALDGAEAAAGAREALPASAGTVVDERRTLVIYAEGVEPSLAWHVVMSLRAPASEWHVMVEARTGSVLAVWDDLRHATGSGQAYTPNPVQQSGNTGLRDNNDATSTALDNARGAVTLEHLDDTGKLRGSYANLAATTATGCPLPYTPGAASEPAQIFNYTRADDRFEEVTAYEALDGVQTWFQSLGFTNVNNRSIPVDVHCTSEDNSYFDALDKSLRFGDGGVDDAEDGDVVVHEYGHAVQEDQVPGFGPSGTSEQDAIGEGFGDFLAGMYYVGNGNATYLATHRYCIAEWDATSYNPVVAGDSGSGCLRWINGRDESDGHDIGNYSGTPTQVHNDGRYWSAAMTCVYEGMGANAAARDNVIRLILAHHSDLTPDASNDAFQDSVDALLLEDVELFGGAHRGLIASCTGDRLNVDVDVATSTFGDFDGDGDADVSVFRPASGTWFVQGRPAVAWGTNGDIPVPGDYDGDSDTDPAVFRPSNGVWFVQGGSTVAWGTNGDIPVPGDYDGDGDTDIAVFRPSSGTWFVAGGTTLAWGTTGDIPVPGDYDGDGDAEPAVFRPSNAVWFIQGAPAVAWGTNGDIPVPGDYDGDGDGDVAVFRPSSGTWFVRGGATVAWGTSGDIPVPGDYDGDGDTGTAVFRPSNGIWFVQAGSTVAWGTNGDIPLLLPWAISRVPLS